MGNGYNRDSIRGGLLVLHSAVKPTKYSHQHTLSPLATLPAYQGLMCGSIITPTETTYMVAHGPCSDGRCTANMGDMAELCPTEPDRQQDSVVASAQAHAASIRRTLLMREYKREHGRAMPPADPTAYEPQQQQIERKHKLRKRDEPPPILKGPIYSAEYWRKWKSRSRAGTRGGSRGGIDTPCVSNSVGTF